MPDDIAVAVLPSVLDPPLAVYCPLSAQRRLDVTAEVDQYRRPHFPPTVYQRTFDATVGTTQSIHHRLWKFVQQQMVRFNFDIFRGEIADADCETTVRKNLLHCPAGTGDELRGRTDGLELIDN